MKKMLILFLLVFGGIAHAALPEDAGFVLQCKGYVPVEDFLFVRDAEGDLQLQWSGPGEAPTDEWIEAQRKPCYADQKREEINTEAGVRLAGVWGIQMPVEVLDMIDGFIGGVLVSGATQAQASWPQDWQDTVTVRNARRTLLGSTSPLSGLELWLADPDRTADEIRDFDVEGWNGWGVARPE